MNLTYILYKPNNLKSIGADFTLFLISAAKIRQDFHIICYWKVIIRLNRKIAKPG